MCTAGISSRYVICSAASIQPTGSNLGFLLFDAHALLLLCCPDVIVVACSLRHCVDIISHCLQSLWVFALLSWQVTSPVAHLPPPPPLLLICQQSDWLAWTASSHSSLSCCGVSAPKMHQNYTSDGAGRQCPQEPGFEVTVARTRGCKYVMCAGMTVLYWILTMWSLSKINWERR